MDDDDDGIVCQWQSDHYHDNDFDSESDLDSGAESDDEDQGACTHISVAYLVRAVDKFLGCAFGRRGVLVCEDAHRTQALGRMVVVG